MPRSATAGTYQAGRTPFVGRGPELAALRERLAAAGHGAGAVVLLAGEPGIGKTRTAEEFATVAEEHGAAVLWGRCLEGEGAPPFWPWIQILRSHARDRDPAILRAELGTGGADLAQIAPLLRERVPDLPPLPTAAPDPSRFRLFDAVTTFLWNVAAARPLVLVLDDLHRADAPSLRLLEWVARELNAARLTSGGPRVLLVGAYRDTEIGDGHPFTATLTELARLPGGERLESDGTERGGGDPRDRSRRRADAGSTPGAGGLRPDGGTPLLPGGGAAAAGD